MAEAAIAIAYPEPWNKGKALGYWLTYRLSGQILGGAINLGLNVDRSEAGKVSYTVYLVFIALQVAGPFVALLLNKPNRVQRKDGRAVKLEILRDPWFEMKETARLFVTKRFLLTILWIGQAVFAEAVFFTYLACKPSKASVSARFSAKQLSVYFSVRARALGSFVSGLVAVTLGNLLGWFLDSTSLSLKKRARSAFFFIVVFQGICWTWAAVNVTYYRKTLPTYDWSSPGFGNAFAVFVLLTACFQINYLFLYFFITHLAKDEPQVIRYAALLRGTESAWQAVSYGITSVTVFARVGGVYWNFALWGVAIWPAWLVLKEIGTKDEGDKADERHQGVGVIVEDLK
jgi:hypothetical protein